MRTSASGLGCPDWPLCHGELVPSFDFHTLIEYSHRMTGTILGLLVIVLIILTLVFHRRNQILLGLSFAALALVTIAGLLGGITVLTELVWWIRLVHLSVAQLLIATLALIIWNSMDLTESNLVSESSHFRWKWKAVASIMIVFVLILSGSYMVGVGASTSCASWPLCRGSLVPEGFVYSVNMGHRYVAAIATIFLAYVAVSFMRQGKASSLLRKTSHCAIGFMGFQFLFGAFIVWSGFSAHMRAAHLSIATLVWLGTVIMVAAARSTFRNDPSTEQTARTYIK